jgi:hypothetical protein
MHKDSLMPALKKPLTASAPSTPSKKVTAKPAAPVTTKRVISKALPKKPVAAPAKPTTKAATKPITKASVVKEVKVEKVKKPKLMRDSFTIPKAEYLVIEALKERAGKLSRAAKKSELLRAGIKALAAMSDAAFLSALAAVPTIKTGRPSAAH